MNLLVKLDTSNIERISKSKNRKKQTLQSNLMHFCYEFFLHGVEKYMSNKIFKIKRPFSMCSVYQKKNSQVTFNKTSFTFLVVSNSDKIPSSSSLVFSEKQWALLSHVICRKIELVASNIINTYLDLCHGKHWIFAA